MPIRIVLRRSAADSRQDHVDARTLIRTIVSRKTLLIPGRVEEFPLGPTGRRPYGLACPAACRIRHVPFSFSESNRLMTKLTDAQCSDLLATLQPIAERAGEIILDYYDEGDSIGVREKRDRSPVTDADEAAEAFILEALAELTPDIPIISEEAAEAQGLPKAAASRFWLVDPLDGTREFLSRNGEFTVNIAFIEDGTPVVGVVHAPARALTWTGAKALTDGADQGKAVATRGEAGQSGAPISVRERPDKGPLVVASRRHGDTELLDRFLEDLDEPELISSGSSLKFCLVATGQADLYPRFGRTMEWDTAAGHAVLRAAGGTAMVYDNGPLEYGKPGFENPYFVARGRP